MYSIDKILDGLAPVALLVASPFFLHTAFKDWRRKTYFGTYGIEVEGIVVRVEEQEMDEHTVHIPIISFSTRELHWITVPYEGGSLTNSLQTGQTVVLRYNPINYGDFVIPADEQVTVMWLFLTVGLGLLAAGIISLARSIMT